MKSKNIKSGLRILMSGNEAMAEAAIKAGCFFYAGYPITPQNEIPAYMAKRMKEEKRVFIQAESELAAINMVFGAAAAGVRALTSSSSPGVSLKQEGISYMAGAQLPAVIINVMRGGPGLGNIASSQSDYFQATRGGGHGDYFTPVLAPFCAEEAAGLVMLGFDMADYYRTPVLILADAIVGQMMEPVVMPAKSDFKKKLPAKTWALSGAINREPNIVKSFFLKEGGLETHNRKLKEKWETIKNNEQRFSGYKTEDAKYLIVAYGSEARIALEAVDILRKEKIKAGLFRPISLWPYPEAGLQKCAKNIKNILVVEQSLGQMLDDVKLSLPGKDIKFLGKTGGGIPSVADIVKQVKKLVTRPT
ncbi:MAG: 3-methyl-2-oxobutanoate dehydrogenase subunit VorB [Candidatus Omnitrophica bacterium]|nr:3-methyl-2-oxobutanoate dehydrogenase subunit VorB [Candidatus Omnitrophota bacterium]